MKRALIAVSAIVAVVVLLKIAHRGAPVAVPEPSGETIVCFGDSLTWGSGADRDQTYPAHLERLIGLEIINSGIPGDTTAGALQRLQSDVLDHHPRLVLITLGGNDLKNGIEADAAFANLEQIVSSIHDQGALAIVGGIDIPIYGRGYPDGYVQLQRDTGCVLVRNVYKGIFGRRELMSDRIHPNGAGYAIMADHFRDAIEPYL
jgi:lysophospholipase L1-like esterase